jgi:hypothetical protein
VRQLARGQTLQRAAMDAHREGCLSEFHQEVNRVFGDTPLAEYVNMMEAPHDADDD